MTSRFRLVHLVVVRRRTSVCEHPENDSVGIMAMI